MKTIKKAQVGKLVKKGMKAATEVKPKVSTWDYPTQKSRDFQRAFLEAYPEKIKKLPKGNNKIDKVKKVKPSYDKYGLEILKDKNGGHIKKAKNGTSLGMKSVKAGFDNNPGVTRADIITAATKKAKKGMKVKKAQMGASVISKMAKKNQTGGPKVPKRFSTIKRPDDSMKSTTVSTMKSGGKMKKCRYGCK